VSDDLVARGLAAGTLVQAAVAEIDLNPIKVLPRGCVVVDALIVPRVPS